MTNQENPKINGEELVKRRPDGTFEAGSIPNPSGRPKGSLDFKTKWFKFIEKVAEQNQLKPDDVEEQLLAVAFKKAKEGDYAFWRDTFDRVYGKPLQKQELSGRDGEPLKMIFDNAFAPKTETNNSESR